ncbi:hypothetical protein ABH966_005478 [Lysinibacillus sp. RC46]|uniref:hypothetical protein n=1 Tax=unclassified Lysinibacillus TaxID=2636778 RepID=UPI0035127DDF
MNILNLELMTATEKVAEALIMRGLFIKVKDNVLLFSKGNNKNDVKDVQFVLNQLNIPFIMHGEHGLEILVNQMPTIKMKKILTAGGDPFSIDAAAYHQYWRFFTCRNYGFRINTFQLEYNMARFVKAANLAGIATYAGCNGHLKKSPRFQFAGPFMAAWFVAVKQRYFQDIKLNYDWKVVYDGFTGAELRATSKQGCCQHKIHEDTLKMAFLLETHATEIRDIKEKCFKRTQKNITRKWVDKEDYTALENWMMTIAWGNEDVINKNGLTRKTNNMAI